MPEINETGNVYGKLRVLRKATDEERGKIAGAYWVCQCECGNTIVTNGRGLRSGDTKSCGCLNREHVSRAAKKKVIDLTGMRFGSLTVLNRADQMSDKYNYALWNCQCDCGETKIVRSSSLLHGITQSCGCIQKKGCFRKFIKDIFRELYRRNWQQVREINGNIQIGTSGRGFGRRLLYLSVLM